MGRVIRVAAASRGAPVARMPARRGIAMLADIPDRERRDGGPELVIRCKHLWLFSRRQAVPMLARRRHEIREPVEKLKRRELDDAVGPWPRGLSRAARADPVGGLVSRQHVADTGDAAAPVTGYRESLERKRRPGAIPQQVFEALKIARHVAVDHRDADACVYRKPAVLSGEHVGSRRSGEQASEPEPADHAVPHPLGERGQIGLHERSGGQERRRPVAGWHEDAIACTHVQVHVVVERRAEAVQEGDGSESRVRGWEGVGVNRYACRSAQQPLDLSKKDLREGLDGRRPVGEKISQSLRHGDHPLPHGHRRDDVIGEMGGGLGHVPDVAGRTHTPSLAGEAREKTLAAARAESAIPAHCAGSLPGHGLDIAERQRQDCPPQVGDPAAAEAGAKRRVPRQIADREIDLPP